MNPRRTWIKNFEKTEITTWNLRGFQQALKWIKQRGKYYFSSSQKMSVMIFIKCM
jgi:hypothetical protein